MQSAIRSFGLVVLVLLFAARAYAQSGPVKAKEFDLESMALFAGGGLVLAIIFILWAMANNSKYSSPGNEAKNYSPGDPNPYAWKGHRTVSAPDAPPQSGTGPSGDRSS